MRALLALLLLANLGFFALQRGWLAPYIGLTAQHEREPQRLAAQVNASSVRVLDKNAAHSLSTTVPRAALCLLAGPFTPDQIDAAEAALAPALWPGLVTQRVDDAGQGAVSSAAAPASRASLSWLRVEPADTAQRERLLALSPSASLRSLTPCR